MTTDAPHGGRDIPLRGNVLAIVQENLERLWRGETMLVNQVV